MERIPSRRRQLWTPTSRVSRLRLYGGPVAAAAMAVYKSSTGRKLGTVPDPVEAVLAWIMSPAKEEHLRLLQEILRQPSWVELATCAQDVY